MGSDVQDTQRSCHEKKRYSTEEVASAVAVECWYQRHVWLRVYSCTNCGGYHLTRQNAQPTMQANWRLPKLSERERNERRKRDRDRRRGRR